jgi:hypothetical protein
MRAVRSPVRFSSRLVGCLRAARSAAARRPSRARSGGVPVHVAALVLAAVVASGACSSPSGSADGPVLSVGEEPELTMLAMVGGELVIDSRTSCLVLDPVGQPVVWPQGATWRADPAAVVLRDGTVLSVGERVTAGGGAVDASSLDAYGGAAVRAEGERCAGSGGRVVLVQGEVRPASDLHG